MRDGYKVFDSEVSPYIEQKDVILCRSGFQSYQASELANFIAKNPAPVEKDSYIEYRPPSVIVEAQDLCKNLPIVKEHPMEWVTPENWKTYAGGVTDSEISVVSLKEAGEGEIGLKSKATFYDEDLYFYYKDNNKEVSLGYTVKRKWVENSEEVGYDIILTEILEVNHLAITQLGRGGESVAVMDSLLGRLKPMRTGLFAWVKGKDKSLDSEKNLFSSGVFDALTKVKDGKKEEIEEAIQPVLDSCVTLKDCDNKKLLTNAVKDCFDNPKEALKMKDTISTALDSLYVSVSGDSIQEIANAFEEVSKSGTVKVTDSGKEDKSEDSKKDDKDDKDDKSEDSDKGKDDKDDKEDKSKDSVLSESQRKEVAQIVKDSVVGAVQETLGIASKKPKKDEPDASLDSLLGDDSIILDRDYEDFLDK